MVWAQMKRFLIYITTLLGLSATAHAESISGKCDHVFDGDSFALVKKGESGQTQIRLYGIDAPEKGQEYAKQAREKLIKLVRHKQVRVDVQSTDDYGRQVGKVYVGKTYINLEMVKAGLAWHYEHHAPEAKDLKKAQAKASAAKKGLWQAENPINPRDWRREHDTAHQSKQQTGTAPPATEGTTYGTCNSVKDGEEFYLITPDGEKMHIYLNGTDAPEQEQDAAACQAAKEALQELVLNKSLSVRIVNSNKNRHYAAVYAGETYINAEMVRRGRTWYSSLHAPEDAALKAADKEARAAKQGIWASPGAEAPWKWRKRNRHELPQSE